MKSISTLAAVAFIATAGVAQAATTKDAETDPCAASAAANAAIIAKAQAASTPKASQKIIDEAIKANPSNATCLTYMAMKMSLNIEPAAGPEEGNGANIDFNNGTSAPVENPSQLNQPVSSSPASPVTAPVVTLPSGPRL